MLQASSAIDAVLPGWLPQRMSSDKAAVGNRIMKARKAAGLTQDELAEKIRALTGNRTTKDSVSRWERGETSPDTDNLAALASIVRRGEGFLMRGLEATAEPRGIAPEVRAAIAARGLPPPAPEDETWLREKAENHGAAPAQLARAYEMMLVGLTARVQDASDTLTAANVRPEVPGRKR